VRSHYEIVRKSKEVKRQAMIHDLLMLGITEYQGRKLEDLDYYDLRSALSVRMACIE
jgi:hypothetical protein